MDANWPIVCSRIAGSASHRATVFIRLFWMCRLPCLLFGLVPLRQDLDVAAEKFADVACTGNAGTARALRTAHSFPEYLSWNIQ
jgi:hypothetical protein